MTRTTGALKRLGVAGIAVATIGTGLVAAPFATTAFAAGPGPVTAVDLQPATDTGAAGTCQIFVATALNTAGFPVAGAVIDVELTDTANQTATFCTGTGPSPAVAATTGTGQTGSTNNTAITGGSSQTAQAPSGQSTNAGGTSTRAEFTTNSDGRIIFGVVGGTFATGATAALDNAINIRAFSDQNNDNVFTAGEPTDTSVLTVTQGGAAGSNQAADAVTAVAVTPPSGVSFPGDTVTLTATLTNANGDAVAGVRPLLDVTAGPSVDVTNVPCTVSDNFGQSTCTYTVPANATAGTDVIRVFVNQSGGATGGFDTGEANDATATRTIQAAPTGLRVDIEPENQNVLFNAANGPAGNTSGAQSANYTVTVTRNVTGQGTAANTAIVRLTVDTTNAVITGTGGSTFNATTGELTFGGAGTAETQSGTFTVTATRPAATDVIRITGTIRGQNAAGDVAEDSTTAGERTSDTVTLTVTNAAANARNVTLSPTGVNTTAGDVRAFTATVTDVNGRPVAGVDVVFSETGTGRFASGTSTVTVRTNAAGQASVDVISTASERGQQTITADITNTAAANECASTTNTGTTAAGTAIRPGNCTASATNTFVGPAVTPGPDTNNPGPNPSDTAVARITLNVTSGRITAGNAPFLFGIVSDRNGNPLRNRDVTILQKRYNTTSFQELQTATDITTNERGEFRIRVQPDQQTAYVARATGTSVQSDAAGSTGRAVIVQVHNRINLATPVANQSASGRALQVRGDLDPNYASVRIGVAALRNGRFTYLTQGITAGDGSFVINVRNLPQGTFALVVYTSARQGNLFGSASRSVTAS